MVISLIVFFLLNHNNIFFPLPSSLPLVCVCFYALRMAKSNNNQDKKKKRKATKKKKKDTIIQSEIIFVLCDGNNADDKCKEFTICKLLKRIKKRNKSDSKVPKKYLNEKVIRKNVKKLIKNGKVTTSHSLSNGNGTDQVDTILYQVTKNGFQSNNENTINDNRDKLEEINGAKEDIPFAELMRRRSSNNNKDSTFNNDNFIPKNTDNNSNNTNSLWDLDDEISRLEKELLDNSNDNDSNDENSSDDESETESKNDGINPNNHNHNFDDNSKMKRKRKIMFGETTVLNVQEDDSETLNNNDNTGNNNGGGGVICLSEFANDRIAPLPQTSLPSCKSKKLKIDKVSSLPEGSSRGRHGKNSDKMNQGLRDAVKEVLAEYTPRTEKIPFYCRVCSHSSSNQQEFLIHKQSEFHKMAVQMEKKASYCNICRKQLTSIAQLQEHLKSKPHRDKLQYLKSRQNNNKAKQKKSKAFSNKTCIYSSKA